MRTHRRTDPDDESEVEQLVSKRSGTGRAAMTKLTVGGLFIALVAVAGSLFGAFRRNH